MQTLFLLLAAQAAVPPSQAPSPAAPPLAASAPRPAAPVRWPIREADYTVHDFRFSSGETLAKLRLHYTTLGQPHRNGRGLRRMLIQ